MVIQQLTMEWRGLLFCLISLCSTNLVAQTKIQFKDSIVYDLNGTASQIDQLFDTDEIIIYINDGFCIGCIEYLIKCKVSQNILFGKVDFSVLSISQYPDLYDWNMYFIDKANVSIDEKKSLVLIIKNQQTDALKIISYTELVKLSDDFTKRPKDFKKELKNYLLTN